jgi:DNA-binding NtrC family response regulator
LPDLVLMDIRMPVMDGLEATRRIRADPKLQAVPIIANSASATPEDEQDSMIAGASAFLTKPIDQDDLMRRIADLLGLTWETEAPGEPANRADGPAMLAPPREEMEVLYELALVGNMRDIRQRAEHIAGLDGKYRPFAAKLSSLAKSYQSKAIVDLVESHMQPGRTS